MWLERFDNMSFHNAADKLYFLKAMMKAAAGYTRDFLQHECPSDPLVKSQQLSSIARAVWTQSPILAQTLLNRSPLAQEHLRVDNDGISIKDYEVFSSLCDNTNTELLNLRTFAISARPSSEKNMSKIQQLHSCDKFDSNRGLCAIPEI